MVSCSFICMVTVFAVELHAVHLAILYIQPKHHHFAVVYVYSWSALEALCFVVCGDHLTVFAI